MQNKPRLKLLKPEEIRRHPELQPRVSIDPSVVAEYRDAILDGAKMPPLTTFFDGVYYYLADGWHRYEAYCAAKAVHMNADVYEGTFRDAKLHALGSNSNHGLRRSNEDKRRSVCMLLVDAEWSKWSDREIARRCNVSASLVADVRSSHLLENADAYLEEFPDSSTESTGEVRTVRRNGTVYQQNTANIGRSSTTSAEEPDAAPSESASFRDDATEDSSKEDEKDFEAYLNGLHKEIDDLRRQNESLCAADRSEEIMKLTRLLLNEENQRKSAEERLQLRQKDLRWFGARFAELRKILNVKEDRDVVTRVRMLKETGQ